MTVFVIYAVVIQLYLLDKNDYKQNRPDDLNCSSVMNINKKLTKVNKLTNKLTKRKIHV